VLILPHFRCLVKSPQVLTFRSLGGLSEAIQPPEISSSPPMSRPRYPQPAHCWPVLSSDSPAHFVNRFSTTGHYCSRFSTFVKFGLTTFHTRLSRLWTSVSARLDRAQVFKVLSHYAHLPAFVKFAFSGQITPVADPFAAAPH
jgi:hypothetical protein